MATMMSSWHVAQFPESFSELRDSALLLASAASHLRVAVRLGQQRRRREWVQEITRSPGDEASALCPLEPPARGRMAEAKVAIPMNKRHLELCSSAEWAEACEQWIIPAALRDERLGDDVLEVGPGPGRTTDVLRRLTARLTAIEIHDDLADALARRFVGTNVHVIHGDATAMPVPAGRFTGAICLTMLHHVPSAERQDQLLAEVCRVLQPAGVFVGSDSLDGEEFRELHVDDVCVPVPPDSLAERLACAGFVDIAVEENKPWSVRFRARAPE